MGGGNAQKTAMARLKAQEKAAKNAKGGSSQLKDNAKAQSLVCNICRQTFLCTSNRAKLQEHIDGKHSAKNPMTFEQCFPGYAK